MRRLFITGTDTDAGKTYVTTLLAQALSANKQSVMCLKPVAAGADIIDGQLKNDDALKLQAIASIALDYSDVNPFCFQEAIAPHIAAKKNNSKVTLAEIKNHVKSLSSELDFCLIEGAGGFLVPLNDVESFADIPMQLNCDVVLVVGIKLGCINHALLTVDAIKARGLNLVGWIANQIQPDMPCYSENVNTLVQLIDAPLLSEVKHNAVSMEINSLFT